MNLSKSPLTDIEKIVLELGLSFSPSQKTYDKQQFCADFYQFIRRLKLTEYFPDKDNTDSYSDTEPETTLDNEIWQKKNPDWYPDKVKENRSNGLTSFIDNITRDIKHLLHANERKYWNNLTNDQRSALLRLSGDKNVVIKPADKGGALVIMDSNPGTVTNTMKRAYNNCLTMSILRKSNMTQTLSIDKLSTPQLTKCLPQI